MIHHATVSHLLRRSLLALSLGLAGFAAASAPALTVITTVPYKSPPAGPYELGVNLPSTDTTQPAITISAANVDLDLNGYFVAGPGNTAVSDGAGNSVIAVGDVANVTIRNGTLSGNGNGIHFGVTTAANSRNYIVDSVTITRCYLYGIWWVNGPAAPGSVIRDCSFTLIGNSTLHASVSVVALNAPDGVRIENNRFAGIAATGSGGISYNILCGDDLITGNTISGGTYGIFGNGKNLNNLTYNCTTAFTGGTNATGNN